MFTDAIYSLTKWFLLILKDRGVDINELLPMSDEEKEYEVNKRKLIYLQGTISFKRAEIVDTYKNLLESLEPIIFSVLSTTTDNWEKSVLTKFWADNVKTIDTKIMEHEEMVKSFEESWKVLEKYENIKKEN